MNEIERDYIRTKQAVGGAIPSIKYILAIVAIVALGVPAAVWLLGIIVMFWWLIIPVGIVVAFFLFQNPYSKKPRVQAQQG